jgi:Tfp pilus assembly protein PilX
MTVAFPKCRSARRSTIAARDERGYVIVFVLALMAIALGMGAAALAGAISSNKLTTRDMRARRAQQAADAGVQSQLYQQSEADLGSLSYNLNGGLLGTGVSIDCIVPNLNLSLTTSLATTYVSGTNACPQALSGGSSTSYTQPVGNHTFVQSEFFPNEQNVGGLSSQREMFPAIVSLGWETSGTSNVYSREKVLLAPIAPLQAIEGMGNVTINGLSLLLVGGLTEVVNGDISTLGTLTLPTTTVGLNLSSSSILPTFAASAFCTNGLLGGCPGLQVSTAHYVTVPTTPCSAGTPNGNCVIQRSPVTVSASKPSCSNSTGAAVTCNNALFGCSSCYSSSGTTNDTFTMSSGTATFGPGDYVFCNFNVTGSASVSTTSSTAAPVRIYIDSPTSSRCAGDSPAGNFTATPGISNVLEPASPLGTTTAPSQLQIYVVGNGTNHGTTVQIGPTTPSTSLAAVYGMIVYAPQSDVTVNVPAACTAVLCTGGVFNGSVIGDNVTISALTITQDLNIGNYPLYAGVNGFQPVRYIQCGANNTSGVAVTALAGTAADTSGC